MGVDVHPYTAHQRSGEFEEVDSFSSNELALDQNVFTQVFHHPINQGEAYLLGRGETANPLQAEGHLALRLMDNTGSTAVQITGTFRITIRTASSLRLVKTLLQGDLEEYDSRDSSDNLKNVEDREPFPRTNDKFTTHEYVLAIEVKPDADDTIDTSPASGNTEIFADGWQMEKTS